MIKKLFFVAALLAPNLAYAGNPSTNLSVQVVPPGDPPATCSGSVNCMLLGFFAGQGTGIKGWLGRNPDFTVGHAYAGCDGGSTLGDNNGFPVIFAWGWDAACPGGAAAASGGFNSQITATLNSQVVPYANLIYAVRINWEWIYGGCYTSPYCVNGVKAPTTFALEPNNQFDCSGNHCINPVQWTQGLCQIFGIWHSLMPNVKIEVDAPLSPQDKTYWPDGQNGNANCASMISLTGGDFYFNARDYPNDPPGRWNLILTTNLQPTAAWGVANNLPLIIPEWCSQYGSTDNGYIETTFTAWMTANNVVAQSYWGDNNFGGFTDCALTNSAAKQAAYKAAFGSSNYTGSYWTHKTIPGDY